MARHSKNSIKLQEKVNELIQKSEALTMDEKEFIIENYDESYDCHVVSTGAFFTPLQLACDFNLDIQCDAKSRVVDLCAGIGVLSFILFHHSDEFSRPKEIVCIEKNPRFVEIGQKILPEATWVCGDVLDQDFINSLGAFDSAISNPPYGKIKTSTNCDWLIYKGANFEFKVLEVASRIAEKGSFLILPESCPFQLSTQSGIAYKASSTYDSFYKSCDLNLYPGVGIDTSIYKKLWKNTEVTVESALFDLRRQKQESQNKEDIFDIPHEELVSESKKDFVQLSLF